MWVLKIRVFFLSRTTAALLYLKKKKNQYSFIIPNTQLVLLIERKGEVQVPESQRNFTPRVVFKPPGPKVLRPDTRLFQNRRTETTSGAEKLE